jgi:hypothetical protein
MLIHHGHDIAYALSGPMDAVPMLHLRLEFACHPHPPERSAFTRARPYELNAALISPGKPRSKLR